MSKNQWLVVSVALLIACFIYLVSTERGSDTSPGPSATVIAAQPSGLDRAKQEAAKRTEDLKRLNRSSVRDACAKHADWDIDTCGKIDRRRVAIDMTGDQVRLAWGNPESINATHTREVEFDQWVYGDNYVYVVNGLVQSVQTSRNP